MKTTGVTAGNLVEIEPYRVLFPIGILHALLGSTVWILYALNAIEYPGISHPYHMMGGFLISFVAGFLLTAIPRFTGTQHCSKMELSIASILAFSSLFYHQYINVLSLLIFLIFFFMGRISKRAFAPPPYFIFLPLGLLAGIFGAGTLSLVDVHVIGSNFLPLGKLFLYHAMMLSVVLGIGSKLIPALLGLGPHPTPATLVESSQTMNKLQVAFPFVIAIVFFFGFLLEAAEIYTLGRILRAICASWIGMKLWKLYSLPAQKTKMAFWLWISAWSLIIGLWVHALFPQHSVHAAHLFFIGGFGLMTMMISSRVILSHGNHGLSAESNSRTYAICSILFLLAALTRFSAPWTPNYVHHLGYSALCWMIAVLAWAYFFIPKIIFR